MSLVWPKPISRSFQIYYPPPSPTSLTHSHMPKSCSWHHFTRRRPPSPPPVLSGQSAAAPAWHVVVLTWLRPRAYSACQPRTPDAHHLWRGLCCTSHKQVSQLFVSAFFLIIETSFLSLIMQIPVVLDCPTRSASSQAFLLDARLRCRWALCKSGRNCQLKDKIKK